MDNDVPKTLFVILMARQQQLMKPKKQGYKSDIVVTELPDTNLEEEKIRYLATIEQCAQKTLGVIEIKKSHEENKEPNHSRN